MALDAESLYLVIYFISFFSICGQQMIALNISRIDFTVYSIIKQSMYQAITLNSFRGGHLHQLQFLLSIPLMLFHFIFDQKKCELKSANLFLFYFIAILRMSMSDR